MFLYGKDDIMGKKFCEKKTREIDQYKMGQTFNRLEYYILVGKMALYNFLMTPNLKGKK